MSEKVKDMFAGIAGKYDLLNNILSFGIHHKWRKITVSKVSPKTKSKILDTACGTGDLAFEFYNYLNGDCDIIATDFCSDMIEIAEKKAINQNYKIKFEIADVMNLKFENCTFDITSISFGIRNVDDTLKGIDELARVTKSDGKVVILEFGQPNGFFKYIYNFYSKYYMPIVGRLFAGHSFAYNYLPETAKKFPCRENFVEIMNQTNRFKSIKYLTLSFGIAYLYIGEVR